MRVLAFGTYEQRYPRNRIAIEGLRRAGVEVIECHEPVWELAEHKAGAALSRQGVVAWARLYARAARRLFRRARAERFDCLLAGYPAHADLPLARLVAGRRPVVFNPLVSLYDTLVEDRRRFAPRSVAGRALRAFDRGAFALADRVVMDTAAHARWLSAELGVAEGKIDVVPVGAEEIFRPQTGVEPPQDRFVVLFYGKLIPLHGLATIVAAAERLQRLADSGQPIRIRVIGSGQLQAWLDAEIAKRGLALIERVAWVDYEELPRELCAAHAALGIFGASDKAQRVVPNKAFQALACGTPLVTADTPAARELLSDGTNARLVPCGDPAALADALLGLRDDEPARRRIGDAGRELFETRLSLERIGEAYRDVVTRAIGGGRPSPGPGARKETTLA